jgi:hypothetical protein
LNSAKLLSTGPSRGTVWRIVENQEQAATRQITHSAAEQSRLELLLDNNKPAYLPGSEHLHWLLKTPFRYPPLRHGSRFGSPFHPGILYASKELETAMTESAVYLWLFRSGPLDLGPLDNILDGRTAIRFSFRHNKVSNLTTAPPFEREQLTNPASYAHSQALGDKLRDTGTAAIWFPSARKEKGTNCAILDPQAIPTELSLLREHWQLRLDADSCWWGRPGQSSFEVLYCDVSDTSGCIPHPAL